MEKELFMFGLREMEDVMEITVIVMAILVLYTLFQLVRHLSINFRHGTLRNVHQHWQLLIQVELIRTKKL